MNEKTTHTDDELAEIIAKLVDEKNREDAYYYADNLVCHTLTAMGYEKSAKAFHNLKRPCPHWPPAEKFWSIWSEGYQVNEGIGHAYCFGAAWAETFREACIKWFEKDTRHDKRLFDPDNMTYWGCRLFDNEADARKAFG